MYHPTSLLQKGVRFSPSSLFWYILIFQTQRQIIVLHFNQLTYLQFNEKFLFSVFSILIIQMNFHPLFTTENLSNQTQTQLENTLIKFKGQHLPLWKFGAFVGYNFLSFSLIALYGYSFKFKFTKPGQKNNINPKQLTLFNIVKQGTKHGILISSLYIGGMYLLVSRIFPFQIFYKLSQIQSKIHSFAIRYDPFYQETMLFAKMRKFGLSQQFVEQIKLELQGKKEALQKVNGLKRQTVEHLANSKKWYQTRKDAIQGLQNFV